MLSQQSSNPSQIPSTKYDIKLIENEIRVTESKPCVKNVVSTNYFKLNSARL